MVKTKEIENLIDKEVDLQLIILFKYILLLSNENVDEIPDEDTIKYFHKVVLAKFHVSSISKLACLFLEKLFLEIMTKIKYKYRQCRKIDEFHSTNSDYLNPASLCRIDKNSSYLVFFVRDLVEYLTKKTTNGIYFCILNYAKNDKQELTKRINVLQIELGKLSKK